MSNENNPEVTPPAALERGTPEHAAAMAATVPSNVPAKFKNEDGSVNMEAFTQSYAELEKQFHGNGPEAVTAEPVAPINAPAPIETETPVVEEEAAPACWLAGAHQRLRGPPRSAHDAGYDRGLRRGQRQVHHRDAGGQSKEGYLP